MRVENGCLFEVTDADIQHGAFEFPEGITSIGNRAFNGCTGLTNITLPKELTSIGNGAFSRCTGLTEITLPEELTSIGNWAFSRCTGLTNIHLPEGITSISNGAFSGCTHLTDITLPEGLTSIGDWAFSGCIHLKHINIIATTPEEYLRIKQLLPNDLKPKARDLLGENLEALELAIQHSDIEKSGALINQMNAIFDNSSNVITQRGSEFNLLVVSFWLIQNNLKDAAAFFKKHLATPEEAAFELISAMYNTVIENKEQYKEIIATFMDYKRSRDIDNLFEKSILTLLTDSTDIAPGASLKDYGIDRCLSYSAIQAHLQEQIELIKKDNKNLAMDLTTLNSQLEQLTIHEINQLINLPLLNFNQLVEGKEMTEGPVTILAYEWLLGPAPEKILTSLKEDHLSDAENPEQVLSNLVNILNMRMRNSQATSSTTFSLFSPGQTTPDAASSLADRLKNNRG